LSLSSVQTATITGAGTPNCCSMRASSAACTCISAQGQGISRAVTDQAFAGLTPHPAVLAFDRRQRGMFHAAA
jgi:hypothetical protein